MIPTPELAISTSGISLIKCITDLDADIAGIDIFNEEEYLSAASITRSVKTPNEANLLRHASRITCESLKTVMKFCKPGLLETHLEAVFTYAGSKFGTKFLSFPTISASYKNSSFLHNYSNSSILKDGSLVLFDCGLKYQHYCGDVTRTFPVNGVFSADQRKVYNELLKIQEQLIFFIKPGLKITEYLLELYDLLFGVLKRLLIVGKKEPSNDEIAMLFCDHGLGHPIGLNNHDLEKEVGKKSKLFEKYSANQVFRPGMVFSCEPGIYFNEIALKRARESGKFKGINWDKAFSFC